MEINMGEKLIPFSNNVEWGYKNEHGKIVIEPQFNYAYPFSEGLAVV
ncbi:MAG: WG repeat-containing protein, partial [candidate division WOR-3 bacterium]